MKIGIVCYPTFGGSGVMATELGMALSEKGHEIHFITYQQPVRLHFHPNIFYHEVPIPAYPLFDYAPYESALASTLVHMIDTHDLDILHVHYAIPHASVAFLAREILKKKGKDIPYITTLHGTDITLVGRDLNYAPVVAFSINESNAITAVSQNLKEETLKNFVIEKEIEVIPNFVDTARFYLEDKQHFKTMLAPNDERIVAHVSNFRKVKRVQDVIKVFKRLSEHVPSKLLMIGDGPERAAAEDLVRCLDIQADVRFLGKQERMEEILNITDLFILPSEYESFGLAALEAMACGVPVISTNAGGLGEINEHGVTGFLSNVGDVDDMAHNALKIFASNESLQLFKDNALAHASKFEKKNIIPIYEALYERVVADYKMLA